MILIYLYRISDIAATLPVRPVADRRARELQRRLVDVINWAYSVEKLRKRPNSATGEQQSVGKGTAAALNIPGFHRR